MAGILMMPKNFENWPLDGEIDIMEYVGYDPNVVHSSVHTNLIIIQSALRNCK